MQRIAHRAVRPAIRRWLLLALAACAVVVTVTQCDEFRISIADPFRIPTESFRPEPADLVTRPSCVLPDVVTRLSNSTPDAWIGQPRRGEGSIPTGFHATGIVRCEIDDPVAGPASIDEVSLGGDVSAVVAALERPSQRERAGEIVDCAEIPRPPAALWLTSASGAVRVHWPSKPCGVQDDPLGPLEMLRETGRRTVMTLAGPPTRPCTNDFTRILGRPTRTDDPTAKPVSHRPVIRYPERAVGATTLCRYRLTESTTGPDAELVSSSRLPPAASTRLLHDALSTHAAPQCNRPATQVGDAELLRPDGSGGAVLTVELDGCRRVTIALFTTIRTAPDRVISAFTGER